MKLAQLKSQTFSEKTDQELAKLCGFHLTDSYQEAIQEAKTAIIPEDNDDLIEDYFIYENSLVYADSEHGGDVYVPKSAIEKDPDFYDIASFEEVTQELLVNEDAMDEDEIAEQLKNFGEPMMRTFISALRFLDGEFLDDDAGELEVQGVKYEDVFDVGGLSRWHDG